MLFYVPRFWIYPWADPEKKIYNVKLRYPGFESPIRALKNEPSLNLP